jgi:hypothetical protein
VPKRIVAAKLAGRRLEDGQDIRKLVTCHSVKQKKRNSG